MQNEQYHTGKIAFYWVILYNNKVMESFAIAE